MGTRSNIGILEPNGSVTYIYCHWDGYVSHHGPILRDHYTTEEKVRALIALGSISSLGEELGEKHDFSGSHDGVCNVYGRDRGESDTDAVNGTVEAFYSDHGLAYLFNPVALSWTHYSDGKAMLLTDAINADAASADA